MKPTNMMIEAAAEAIGAARAMRRGCPPIVGILNALPRNLRDELIEEAQSALEAAEPLRNLAEPGDEH